MREINPCQRHYLYIGAIFPVEEDYTGKIVKG